MSQITVVLPRIVQHIAGGKDRVDLEADTVACAIERLEELFAGVKARIFSVDGRLHRFVNLYLNQQDIRELEGLHTPLSEGDELHVLVAMAGG